MICIDLADVCNARCAFQSLYLTTLSGYRPGLRMHASAMSRNLSNKPPPREIGRAGASPRIKESCLYRARYITQYGSTVVFVFFPYIRKFSSCSQFQVNSTSDDFTA